MKDTQSGSVFVYILVGVVLFAALSFSLTRNNQSNFFLMSKGSAKAAASQIRDFGTILAAATEKMEMAGVSETEISFENPVTTLSYANPNCAANNCRIFAPGGKIPYSKPDPSWFIPSIPASGAALTEWKKIYKEWYITGSSCAGLVGTGDFNCIPDAASQYDLILFLTMLKKDVCDAINKSVGLDITSHDTGDSMDNLPLIPFRGVFDAGHYGVINLYPSGSAVAVSEGCYLASAAYSGGTRPLDGTYTYFKVLLAR